MNKGFHTFLFVLFSLAIFSCNNEAAKVEDNEPKGAKVAQDSSSKEEVTKAAEKTLLGKWFVMQMKSKDEKTQDMEKGALVFEFEKDGKISILNQENNSSADYELIEEENIIKITNTDDAPETWTIKEWTEKTLIFTAKSPDGEEALVTLER